MPRPPLAIGSWGSIARAQLGPKKWRARARFRDFTGRTSQVEARGASGAAAQRALEAMLRSRVATAGEDITGATRIAALGKAWLAEAQLSDRTPQTLAVYGDVITRIIDPGLGEVRIREATVSAIDRFLKATHRRTPSRARVARIVLSQMMGMAARHDAISSNPVREVAVGKVKPKPVRALSIDDVQVLRRAVQTWISDPTHRGAPRSVDLPDVVDVLLATGARIGELYALRWSDIDLAASPATLTIAGTIVDIRGRGLSRQDHPKSAAGFRTLTLPRFAVETLLRRRGTSTANPLDLVFPSRTGGLRSPANFRRQWRQVREAAGFDWVVPHTFRKTVATLVDQERSTANAASQLGHSKQGLTASRYVQRAAVAPDVSDVLQQFAAQRHDENGE